MNKPRILDLFCGAGGAAEGYAQAGFDVYGIDIRPQPNFPFTFAQDDALEFLDVVVRHIELMPNLAAIHASPPCQAFTAYRRRGEEHVNESPDLVAATREALEATGLPYVIENVESAPLVDPILICGSMLDPVMDIRRHRLFEANWPLEPPLWPCRHKLQVVPRYPGGASRRDHGDSRHLVRATVEIGTWDIELEVQNAAMEIDWMTLKELSQAIPPRYTAFIGEQLLAYVTRRPALADLDLEF